MGQKHFKSAYEKEEILGRGSFATVWKCRRKSDNATYAVKIIKKKNLSSTNQDNISKTFFFFSVFFVPKSLFFSNYENER
jgi:serine/threonine protein kinase